MVLFVNIFFVNFYFERKSCDKNDKNHPDFGSLFENNFQIIFVFWLKKFFLLIDLSRKSEKSKSLAGTFGSAVRRKVRAVLARRGSSSGIELKSSIQRRYNSETKLNKIGQQKEKATITSASSK